MILLSKCTLSSSLPKIHFSLVLTIIEQVMQYYIDMQCLLLEIYLWILSPLSYMYFSYIYVKSSSRIVSLVQDGDTLLKALG